MGWIRTKETMRKATTVLNGLKNYLMRVHETTKVENVGQLLGQKVYIIYKSIKKFFLKIKIDIKRSLRLFYYI